MRANRPLHFDGLETRQLLTKVVAPGAPALAGHEVSAMVINPPVDLTGTLAVNAQAKQVVTDNMGGQAVTVPIRGNLKGLGAVRGYWVETRDPNGRLTGPDELHLQNPKGRLTVSFTNPLNLATTKPTHAATTVTAAQRVTGASGAYNHATESGTVALTITPNGRSIRNLVLVTGGGINSR